MASSVGLTDLIVLALATGACIEAWHHGKIFNRVRAWLEKRNGFLPDLLLCPFCLSYWVPPILLAAAIATALLLPEPYNYVGTCVLYALAATRLSNLVNDIAYFHCRTPNREEGAEANQP